MVCTYVDHDFAGKPSNQSGLCQGRFATHTAGNLRNCSSIWHFVSILVAIVVR